MKINYLDFLNPVIADELKRFQKFMITKYQNIHIPPCGTSNILFKYTEHRITNDPYNSIINNITHFNNVNIKNNIFLTITRDEHRRCFVRKDAKVFCCSYSQTNGEMIPWYIKMKELDNIEAYYRSTLVGNFSIADNYRRLKNIVFVGDKVQLDQTFGLNNVEVNFIDEYKSYEDYLKKNEFEEFRKIYNNGQLKVYNEFIYSLTKYLCKDVMTIIISYL